MDTTYLLKVGVGVLGTPNHALLRGSDSKGFSKKYALTRGDEIKNMLYSKGVNSEIEVVKKTNK